MAGEWYPQPGMDQDLVNRILMDYLHQLRGQAGAILNSVTEVTNAIATTVVAVSGGGGSTPSSSSADITIPLTVALTNIDAPVGGPDDLFYFLDQDVVGGRVIHWNTGFAYASDGLGQMLASTRSVFHFRLDSLTGSYVQAGQQTTDMAA